MDFYSKIISDTFTEQIFIFYTYNSSILAVTFELTIELANSFLRNFQCISIVKLFPVHFYGEIIFNIFT